MSEDDELKVDHLSERELLIIVCRDVRSLKKLEPRIRSLENWRIFLTGGWVALAGAVGALLAWSRAAAASAGAAAAAMGIHQGKH